MGKIDSFAGPEQNHPDQQLWQFSQSE